MLRPTPVRLNNPSRKLRISALSRELGLSADTLRYYEKIGLLPRIARTTSGIREYTERDVSRLLFIQRAQKMAFSLSEIEQLLVMRDNPQRARKKIRELAAAKLVEVEGRLEELTVLRNEMRLLINLCSGAKNGCPIIETLGKVK